jgi:hypothetical protein
MIDPVARDVIAAFDAAESTGLPPFDCYRASVDTWRHAHPDQTTEYASMQAVEVILKAKIRLRVPD